MRDPIVEEVRRRRVEHCRRLGNDLDAIYAELKAAEKNLVAKPITRPARHVRRGGIVAVAG